MAEQTPTTATMFNNYTAYDYDKQAWVVNGHYVRCGHPDSMNCQCYGRIHEGEQA